MRVKNNPQTAYLLGGSPTPFTQESICKWIAWHRGKEDESLFAIVDTAAGTAFGHIGLYEIDRNVRCAELGILIGLNEYLGKGFGTDATETLVKYAFEGLDLHRVYAEVITENVASMHLFEKCGFTLEGIKRDANYKNGRYYDVAIWAILNNR